jgi:PhnB protein
MPQTARPQPIPDRYRRVTPVLVVDGADRALEFYAAVFDAVERVRFAAPDGTIAHAEVEIGDSVAIVEDALPYMGTQAPPAAVSTALPRPSMSMSMSRTLTP